MINKLAVWEMIGFFFVIILGTALHFVYKWLGYNRIAGIFSPVNESTWEHLKLLFVPMLLYSTVEYLIIGKEYNGFITAKSMGIVLGILTIVMVFYTYTGIIGEHFLLADILTFILGATVAYTYSWQAINKIQVGTETQVAAVILIAVLTICFSVFTFYPPHIPLFIDPVSRKYGINT